MKSKYTTYMNKDIDFGEVVTDGGQNTPQY